MEISDKEIIEIHDKDIKKFGGSAHVILSKKLIGKHCKIIVVKTGFFE